MAGRTTITSSSGFPTTVQAGTTLRTGPWRYLEVTARTRTELDVVPVGKLRAAALEFHHSLDALLRAAGWYCLLDAIVDALSRLGGRSRS